MLKDLIESIRKEIDDIERRQRELKLLRAQKKSELNKALYRQAVEGMPFPSGTKVTVIYRNFNGILERTVCYLGNPKPTGNKYWPYALSFFQEMNGQRTNIPKKKFHHLQVVDIQRFEK